MSRTVIWPIELGVIPSAGAIRAAAASVPGSIESVYYERVNDDYVRLDFVEVKPCSSSNLCLQVSGATSRRHPTNSSMTLTSA
jgi:hypothetical protein